MVHVSGADAIAYLQTQLSQDIEALQLGATSRSFLLAPTGHVVGWFRLTRHAEDGVLIDTERGAGAAIVARLERFKLRMKVDIVLEAWTVERCWESPTSIDDVPEGALLVPRDWPRHSGTDLLVPSVAAAPVAGSLGSDGGSSDGPTNPTEANWRRIDAGVPEAGPDFAVDGTVIPAELGEWAITSAVDFTKGCYTGQELVARVDSRGNNVPKPLRLLRLDDEVPPSGATVLVEGRESGHVTSSARTPDGDVVALAVVARRVEVPSEVVLAWDGFETTSARRATADRPIRSAPCPRSRWLPTSSPSPMPSTRCSPCSRSWSTAPRPRTAPSCTYLNQDAADGASFWVYELYTDDAALGVHGGSDTMAKVMVGLDGKLAETPELIVVHPVKAKGIEV